MPTPQYQFLVDFAGTQFENDLIARGLAAQDQPSTYDITDRVLEVGIQRGRTNELGAFDAGSMHLLVDNSDWRFTPDYGASPLYGYLRPGAMLKTRVAVPDYTNLVSMWCLDEPAASTRFDSHGTNHLSPSASGTVSQVAGLIGNAASFDGTEWLRVASNASLQVGDIDFTVCAWVYLTSNARGIIAAKDNNAGNRQWRMGYIETTQRFYFVVSNDGTTEYTVTANTFGAPSLNTWYFVMGFHDSVNNVIGISVNNGTIDTLAHSLGVYASGNGDVTIGAEQAGSTLWQGYIDQAMFYKSVLATVTSTTAIGTLILDQFTDANGTNLTAHTIAPTNVPATSWALVAGTIQTIQSNRARGISGGFNTTAFDAGVSDTTLSAIVNFGSAGTKVAAITARVTDANNLWWFYWDRANIYIVERASGVQTTRATAVLAASASTDYTMQMVLSGTTITCTVNGANQISYGSATSNQAVTKHGIMTLDNVGTGVDFDNFQVT